MTHFAKMGEVVLNFAEVLAVIRALPTEKEPGAIEVYLKGGHSFRCVEGSSSYASMAAWLRATPEFGPSAQEGA